MDLGHNKLRRLAYAAQLYYLEDKKQSDIAKELGVSRPMVSKMLSEARELGIVRITIENPDMRPDCLLEELTEKHLVKGGVLVEDGKDDDETNLLLSEASVKLLQDLRTKRLGIGWGYIVGQMIAWLEKNPQVHSTVADIYPMVGNAGIPARNYQSNENVRLMAKQLGASPHFLSLPALPTGLEEKEILCSTELYREFLEYWESMDTALVNIGNYPSSPDFASLVRYGSILQKEHTCGRLLVYYFNEDGKIIESNQDFAIQIPLEILKKCPNIVGICSANTNSKALRGALNSGIFTHIIARASLVKELTNK